VGRNAENSSKKWPFLTVLGFLLGILAGCGQPTVKARPLPQPLPTQMVFRGSVFKVQKAISKIFKSDSKKIFQNPSDFPPAFSLYWKGTRHPEEVTLFKNPVNENDVYVSCNELPICKSRVYSDWRGRPLEYLADFQLHIIPQGAKETLVKIITVNPKVMAGKTYLDVQPTTVEENEILNAMDRSLKR
jgi:hypothetical protein